MTDHARCWACNGKACRIRERAELGQPNDRVTTCDGKDCQPDSDGSKWHTFNLDGTLPETKEKPA